MYLPKNASKARQREAQNARNNRAEIVKALFDGQITKRDLFKWGIFTGAGVLAAKHGLSPFAQSAFGVVPTGTPRSPLFGADSPAEKFRYPMVRLDLQTPVPLTNVGGNAYWGPFSPEPDAKRLSWHDDYTNARNAGTPDASNPHRNPINNRGPKEGRPWGEEFAHQRWNGEFFPKQGYVMSLAQQRPNTTKFHPAMVAQQPNSVWSFGPGSFRQNGGYNQVFGQLPAPLFRARYGEPMIVRVYNNLPTDPSQNNGFGRNESSLHFHNAHNGAESDGACNAFHYPGTFYDYRWSTTLARRDKINTAATDRRASGPDGNGGLTNVPGDYRELQGTMWAHDHRFFFTAENVYKGSAMMINYYSGPDRGHETLPDGVNLKLPSGRFRDWGNLDFDVNLMVSDAATDQAGQLFFDITTTDGFVGDMLLVNHQYAPHFEVLPRKYRFRILNACMSRFVKLALADGNGNILPFQMIANDGNLLVNPILLTALDEQGVAERYDIVVDFARFRVGDKIRLVNLLQQTNGQKPDGAVTMAQALAGVSVDPAVGPILEFRISGSVASVDANFQYTLANSATWATPAPLALKLTDQIPIVAPVRERVVTFAKSSGDSRDPQTQQCTPDCPANMPFPWSITVNGQAAHSMNANRVSLLIPKPGEVEHWTYINTGSGWDHPIHLHFEEGITIDRGAASIPASEKLVRKDVWRLKPQGRVKFQVQFGEYGGSYVNHCHNTVHEDFAMLLRYQILGNAGTPQVFVTKTPNPTLDGVNFTDATVLPEGDPRPPV
jgi:FtsP/CotA-like multicopper oxidase with cupredoxin domain